MRGDALDRTRFERHHGAMNDQPMSIDTSEMGRLAAEHDLNSAQAAEWSVKDIGFAEEYLRTHGLVNYPTFIKIIDFFLAKQAAGSAYAERQATAAASLRAATALIVDQDAASATGVSAVGSDTARP